MADIDLEVFSKLASEKLGKDIQFIEIEKIGSGYHSDGFKLKAEDGSFQSPIDFLYFTSMFKLVLLRLLCLP